MSGQTFITGTTTASGPGTYSAAGNNALIISDPNSDIIDPAFLTLTGGITTATNGVQGVVVGLLNGEKGSLRIEYGSVLTNSGSGNNGSFGGVEQVSGGTGYIGLNAGATGTAAVSGIGSRWTNSNDLHVGFSGSGTLNIQNGGNVSNTHGFVGLNSNSQGTVTVNGTDSNGVASKWTNQGLFIGVVGTGTLNIQIGGCVSNAFAFVGYHSQGSVSVDGTDSNNVASKWMMEGELVIGNVHGSGTLNIQNGGSVSNRDGYVGFDFLSQGTVTVTGTGSNGVASTWTNSGNLSIAHYGSYGTLNIQDGGSVSNMEGHIGYGYDFGIASQGTVTVTGTDSNGVASKWVNNSYLVVGLAGSGTLNILNGGNVSNTDGYVGFQSASQGSVTVTGTGSTWTNSGNLILAGTGTSPSNATAGAGNLTVDNGGKVVVGGSLIVHTNGKLAGDGGTIEGNVTSSGTVAPGNSTGILTIDGNYTQGANGKLEIQLGGLTAGAGYDQLLVMGNVTLNSSAVLDVSMWNAFELGLNQSFDILAIGGGTLTGTFLNLNDGDLVDQFNGVDLYIDYHIGGVTLFTAVPEPTSLMLIGIAILFGASPRNRRRK